jgi:hypothetical protein
MNQPHDPGARRLAGPRRPEYVIEIWVSSNYASASGATTPPWPTTAKTPRGVAAAKQSRSQNSRPNHNRYRRLVRSTQAGTG